jgi:hypothetical protein
MAHNPKKPWDERFLKRVNWDNIYRIAGSGLIRHRIRTGQVLQHIGCPHAARAKWAEIDDPASLAGKRERKVIRILLKGCSFCDVAVDKGFYGSLSTDTVLDQIGCLPEATDGRKVPFELINENPLPGLPGLLKEIRARKISLSQINLILRADWFLKGEGRLREALGLARVMGVRILLSSIGFEAFDDSILRNLNKGLTVKTNLEAIHLMRSLKAESPKVWGYSRSDGAVHGFIHPTPWDTEKTWANTQKIIDQYELPFDILPDHSTPLIIHHASGLGDWIREVEKREKIRFRRYVSIVGWWKEESFS